MTFLFSNQTHCKTVSSISLSFCKFPSFFKLLSFSVLCAYPTCGIRIIRLPEQKHLYLFKVPEKFIDVTGVHISFFLWKALSCRGYFSQKKRRKKKLPNWSLHHSVILNKISLFDSFLSFL